MAALAQAQPQAPSSASISHHSIRNALAVASPRSHKTTAAFRISTSLPTISVFATASPLVAVLSRTSYRIKRGRGHATSVPIRCEQQSTKEGNSGDVWLGRLAMVGFAVAITVEISTGKGLLENFGLTSPLPTVALAVTALVGVLIAVFIFQSASKN